MDLLTIDKEEYILTKDSIRKSLEQGIKETNDEYYRKLTKALKGSRGDYVRNMKQQLKREHQMISELASLYLKTLEYMQEAINQVEELDKRFSGSHILEGGK